MWMYPNSDQTVGRAPCLTDYHLPDYNVRPGSRRCLLTPVTSAKRHLLTVSRGPGIFLASGERLVLCLLSGLSSKTTNPPKPWDRHGGWHTRPLFMWFVGQVTGLLTTELIVCVFRKRVETDISSWFFSIRSDRQTLDVRK